MIQIQPVKNQIKDTSKETTATGRRLLTLESVTERWDCSRRYIEGLIASGVLPALKMGKRMTRIRETDIEAYENRFLPGEMNRQPGA